MKVTVIIPAYNEETKIAEVISELKQYPYNVVVVDDCSRDNTGEVLQKIEGITVLRHLINRGQGAALRTGTEYALRQGADIIVHFDADGQMMAREIGEMVEFLLKNNADIVLGSRFLGKASNVPFLKKLVLKAGIWFTYFFSGIKLTDTHNGFRVLTRGAAEAIEINQDRMAHASEILDKIVKKKLKWLEYPVTIRYSDYSKAKGQSPLNALKIAGMLFLSRLIKK